MRVRIALTFNLKRHPTEDEAEFDSAETIAEIASLLEGLGHVVVPVDVTGSLASLAERLEHLAPDLVFNMAEGRRGPFREALVPALLEDLGLPHTGSSASVLALCLDKALTNRVVAAAGVRVPRSTFVRDARAISTLRWDRPVIVKPNFEGSSKGITQASVVTRAPMLGPTALRILARYPEGVLVEDYLEGADVSVGFVEGMGILPAIGYAYEPTGPHAILDLTLKQSAERIRVEVPARFDTATLEALEAAAGITFDALGVVGYGRADFRVTPSGQIFFLDMNPLPTLALADEDLYAAAASTAMAWSASDVLGAITEAACTREASMIGKERASSPVPPGRSRARAPRVSRTRQRVREVRRPTQAR